jgi:hypothetical protein
VWIVPLVQVDIGLLADQVGITTTDTLDFRQGVHDLLLAIDVGVQKTQDLIVPLLRSALESQTINQVLPTHLDSNADA